MPSHGKYYDQNHAPARAWPDKSSSISDRSDSLQRPLAQAVAWVLAARPLRPLAAAWETLQALLTLARKHRLVSSLSKNNRPPRPWLIHRRWQQRLRTISWVSSSVCRNRRPKTNYYKYVGVAKAHNVVMVGDKAVAEETCDVRRG